MDKKPLQSLKKATAPSILLTATLRWPIAARLAIAFAQMGCRVDVLCPRQHPVTRTRASRRCYPYTVLKPLVSLCAAIKSAAPDFIIPCDDDAAVHLQQLYVRAGETVSPDNDLRELIVRSLGAPEACPLATTRGEFIALVAEEGVRVPETSILATPYELTAWCTRHGFPAVIKNDASWGGQGVSIVHNLQEAQRALELMSSRPAIVNAIVRMLLERDPSFFLKALRSIRRPVTIQRFISGTPANRAVACWQGQILAGISVEAIHTQHPTGPATVVRVIDHPEMEEAVRRLVRRLGVSGLWGIDFILEASSGAAYVIEMNPRATPVCHLSLSAGRNLPAAIYAQLMGTEPSIPSTMIDHDVIAMFPGEWHRNTASPYLCSNYHDIPLDEPGLIQDCLNRPWAERGLIARLWSFLRPKTVALPTARQDPIRAIRSNVNDTRDCSN